MEYCWSREIYRSGQKQFSSAQRAQRKFRVESRRSVAKLARSKKILQYKLSLALKQLRHLAVRVKPISFALRACFLGHYRMARMSQSASSCGLASWMRPHMIPDTHSLKLLFLARYTSRSICQYSISISFVLKNILLFCKIYLLYFP